MQVAEAAVIAAPHPKWTERPLLIVVRAEGSQLTKDQMLQFLDVSPGPSNPVLHSVQESLCCI